MRSVRLATRLTAVLGLFALASVGSVASAVDPVAPPQQQGAIPQERPNDKQVVLSFVRKGGFAGFDDDLVVYGDYSYAKRGRNGNRGALKPQRRQALAALLAKFGKVEWSRGNAPGVADGMQESITINGKGDRTELAAGDAELGAIQTLAAAILQDARPPRQVVLTTFQRNDRGKNIHDSVTIRGDYSVMFRRGNGRYNEAELSQEQQQVIKRLVAQLGRVNWHQGTFQGTRESINFSGDGDKQKLNEQDAELTALKSLFDDILGAN